MKKVSEKHIDPAHFKKQYEQIGSVYCPAFKEAVAFNARGLNHIFFEGSRRPRKPDDVQTRMRLIERATKLLSLATIPSGYACDASHSKQIHYWEFMGLIDNRRIMVIVRQLGTGKKHFWSVIPKWRVIEGRIINAGGRITF